MMQFSSERMLDVVDPTDIGVILAVGRLTFSRSGEAAGRDVNAMIIRDRFQNRAINVRESG